jgi:hypothetical protein
MEKIATCIKEHGNWGSKLEQEIRIDHERFDAEKVKDILPKASPKLHTLIERIKELDREDLKTHGRMFKHFIYSDIKSGYGAKLIASALQANGFQHAYRLKQGKRGLSFTLDLNPKYKYKTFSILTSVAFYGKPIGVNFRRELLRKFNERPENVYGENIRIMVLDSGFREGVDLFDVKYVHLFEPITTLNDQKQAIGRATRFCGQKGLNFDPIAGWPLHVYRYETVIPEDIKKYLETQLPELAPADTFFQLFLKYSNIDPKKIAFANELEKVVIDGAVDKEYTKNVHNFKIGGNKKYVWPPVKVENLCVDTSKPDQPKGASVVNFSPSQEFIREYFTPKNTQKGMLLFHSVGTGKTCSAIATASSSFETEDYSILYVTRYTLKPDVWKNMFDQVCSVVVQKYLNSGKSLPEAQAAKRRLISKKWMEPMSYRQLSNMLDGKNKLYDTLIQQNGSKDPLRKTLLIIDEAHKLFAADVEGQEKADIDVIQKALNHSYSTSGNDSVKLLLMTATPYTSDAMDMIRLMNLMLEKPLPEDFETFAKEYLDERGVFTESGLKMFNKNLKGNVSYLNREKDIRSFAHPLMYNIQVPMSDYEYKQELYEYIDLKTTVQGKERDLYREKGNYVLIVKDLERKLYKAMENVILDKDKQYNTCLADASKEFNKQNVELNKKYSKEIEKCKDVLKYCKKEIKDKYKKKENELKQIYKEQLKNEQDKRIKEQIKETLDKALLNLQLDEEFDIQQCKSEQNIVVCEERLKEFNKKNKDNLKEIKNQIQEKCKEIKQEKETYIKNQTIINKEKIKELDMKLNNDLKVHQDRLNELQKELDKKNITLLQHIQGDVSQRTGLETCLKSKIQPAYKQILKNEVVFDDALEEVIDEESGLADKIYLISGHGGEDPKVFERRMVMPKDKVLIVFPECARPNFLDTGCEFMDLFNDPKKRVYLRNPIKYRKQLKKIMNREMRIYLPGEYVPSLSTNLFLNFNKDKTVIVKSGVFQKIEPINRSTFKTPPNHLNLGSNKCLQFSGVIDRPLDYNTDIHREVFKGNIYKPATKGKTYTELEYRNFNVAEILESIGTGIYYYIGCRSAPFIPVNYEAILEKSEQQQYKSKRSARFGSLEAKIKGKVADIHMPDEEIESKNKEEDIHTPHEEKITPESKNKPSKEDKALVKILSADIEAFEKEILSNTEYIGALTESQSSQLKAWKEQINKIPTYKTTRQLLYILKSLQAILTTENPKSKLTNELSKDGTYYSYFIGYVFNVNKINKVLYKQLYGVIPANQIDKTKKCSTSGLMKRVKKLYTKNITLDLPKEIQEWNAQVFLEWCQKTRDLLT